MFIQRDASKGGREQDFLTRVLEELRKPKYFSSEKRAGRCSSTATIH